jgi:Predicted phosphohydrolases
MRFAHISDLHVIAAPAGGLIRDDAALRARALLADLMAFRPALDLVVITGDNVNDGRPGEYRLLAALLADLAIPFVILPGNHDTRAGFRAAFPALPYADPERLHHEWRAAGLRILALDSLVEGRIGGALDDAQLDWLESRLASPFEGQTVVALHHPPVAPQMGQLDRNILVGGRDRLLAILAAVPGPVRLLCGHMHRPFAISRGNLTVFAAASTAFQFALRLDFPEEPESVEEPYRYTIHLTGPDDAQLVHIRFPSL